MIYLTRLNQVPLVINSDLIEHIEVTPDTVVVLTSGEKYLVLESADEVIERVVQFRHRVFTRQPFVKAQNSTTSEEHAFTASAEKFVHG
jgi:flagellar protein FlbD